MPGPLFGQLRQLGATLRYQGSHFVIDPPGGGGGNSKFLCTLDHLYCYPKSTSFLGLTADFLGSSCSTQFRHAIQNPNHAPYDVQTRPCTPKLKRLRGDPTKSPQTNWYLAVVCSNLCIKPVLPNQFRGQLDPLPQHWVHLSCSW